MSTNYTGHERLAIALNAIGISMSKPTTEGGNLVEAIYSYSVVSGDEDLKDAIEANHAKNTEADKNGAVVIDHD